MRTARRGEDLRPRLDQLKDARRRRGLAVSVDALKRPVKRLRDDITVGGIVSRRAKCRKCKYPFDYRMHGMVCPECGTLRDDYPARLITVAQFAGACVVGVLLFSAVMWILAR